MFLGRLRLGDWLPLSIQTVDGANTPTLPSGAPFATIGTAAGAITETVRLSIRDRYVTTAFFQMGRRLGSSPAYAVGRYSVLYQWDLSGTYYGHVDEFEIVAGGDANGNVIGMHTFERPEATNVLHLTDAGILYSGRNPQ